MRSAVKTLEELGEDLVLAPERHVVSGAARGGVPLGELVVERTDRALARDLDGAVVLDTSHAKDGLLDLRSALRDRAGARSAKKIAREGDLLVSRLRPYLRQIALVHPAALALAGGRPLCVSTEFYVLSPRSPADDLAYLLPLLLGAEVQEALAGAQEGGHHPRVPRASLLSIGVPRSVLASRARAARRVRDALGEHYQASRALMALLG